MRRDLPLPGVLPMLCGAALLSFADGVEVYVDIEPPWVVCKFGGTSVSSRARWDTIADVVRTHRAEGRHPFLVCSALQGVSDQLEALCRQIGRAHV